jgi:ABC-type uncharacterized transport system substrate-binding protein
MYKLILLALLVVVGCSTQPTQTPEPTVEPTQPESVVTEPIQILRLDSNHEEFAWSQEIRRGILEGLSDNGIEVDGTNVTFEDIYLDTKRNTSEEYFEQISAETIARIEETQPDVVIVNDDTATRLVVQPMRSEGVPFVLLGLNGRPEDYELDSSTHVTGVLERPHVSEMMEWIEQVFGSGTRISILAEDSITSERMFGDGSIVEGIEASPVTLAGVTFMSDYSEWQEYVRNVDETSDVLFLGAYASLRRANGDPVEPLEALQWTLDNSPIPVMGFWEEAVHIGTLGGPIISGYVQGYEAALKAVMVLQGTPPSEIPFSVPPRGKLMINRQAMEHWNVNIPLSLLEVSAVVEV